MNGFSSVTVLGTLGRDAEQREFNGKKVTTLRLVVSDSWKDSQGNKQEKAAWITAKTWNKLPDFILQGLSKGAQVVVHGSLEEESWEKDGQKHSQLVIAARSVEVPNAPRRGGEQRTRDGSGSVQYGQRIDNDDQTPF